MEFLLASHRETARRFKLIQLLLLLCRVLVIALFVLALARPIISGESWFASLGGGRRHAAIVLDNSFSMRYESGGKTILDRAKDLAGEMVSSLSPGDSVSLVAASDRADTVLTGETRRDAVGRALDGIEPSFRTTDLYPAVREAVRLLALSPERAGTLSVFTDGCRNAWGTGREADWKALGDLVREGRDPIDVEVVLLGEPGAANRATVRAEPENRILTPERPVSLEVAARRWGTGDDAECGFDLSLEGREQGTIQAPWTGGPGSSASTGAFTFPLDGPGPLFGSVSIAADSLPADDVRFFSAPVRDRIRVLCVDGEEAALPRDDETFFLAQALNPGGPGGSSSPIEVRVIHEADLLSEGPEAAVPPPGAGPEAGPDSSGTARGRGSETGDVPRAPPGRRLHTEFEPYDVVILANSGRLTPEIAERLKDRVYQGGGLIIFPGDQVPAGFYSSLFGPQFMPARLGEATGTPGAEESIRTFASVDRRHPAFDWFHDEHLPLLAEAWVYRRFPLSLENGSADVLASFGPGEPAIVEGGYGAGKVVVFSFPADTEWTNLPAQPIYLPLLHSLVYSLVQDPAASRNVLVGEDVAIRLPAGAEPARVSDRTGALVGRVAPGEDGRGVFSGTDRPGLYFVAVTGEEEIPVAVNVDPAESDLEVLSGPETIAALTGFPVRVRSLGSAAEAGNGSAPGGPVEVWPYFLGAAAFFLLVELLVAGHLDRARSAGEEPAISSSSRSSVLF